MLEFLEVEFAGCLEEVRARSASGRGILAKREERSLRKWRVVGEEGSAGYCNTWLLCVVCLLGVVLSSMVLAAL